MLTLSWGIIVNHQSTARAISRAVSEKISPSGKATTENLRPPPPIDTCSELLQSDYWATVADVRYCVEHEHARDLTGVLFSRTGLGWTGRMTAESVRSAALTMAPLLVWSDDRTEREIEAMLARLRDDHRYDLG